MAAVARRDERPAAARRGGARDALRAVGVRSLHQQSRVPRGDPREPFRGRRHRLCSHRRSKGRSGGRTPDLRCARCRGPAAHAGRGRAARDRHHDGEGADGPRTALRRADCSGRRHEDRDRDGTDARPARARRRRHGRARARAARHARTPSPSLLPDRLRARRDDVRASAAAIPQAPRRRAVGHRPPDRAHDRRHVPADARPRRADAPADAGGARGGVRQARRVRSGAFLGRARPAHAHVQPHDATALRVAGGGRELPEDARGEGRAAHARARDRDGARVQARAARHPHRAAEPRAPQPAAEADPRAVAAQRRPRRVPLPRLRPLQAHQRHARPRLGRPAAAGGGAAAHRRRARVGHGRAPGRRRVRRDPAGPRPGARDVRDDDGARADPGVVPCAFPPRRPDADADVLDRRFHVPARRRGHRDADQAGGHRDVRRQGSRPQRLPVLHGRHERARAGAAAARDRHAPRPAAERILPGLPAAGRPADGPRGSRRSAAALARSGARRDTADGVHPDRRGIGNDPGARRARAARRLPAGGGLAPEGHDAAPVRQPVGAAAAARQLPRRGRGGAPLERPRAAIPRPRDHGKRDHHASGKGRRHAREAEGARHLDHRGRLRHRLLQPVVSRAAADRGGEDRPALRARPRAQQQRRGDHAGHHRAVALARPARDRRRRRDRAQFEFLKSHGCEAAQGFLIGRPLEEQEFLAWWKAQDQESRAVLVQPDMWQPEGSD